MIQARALLTDKIVSPVSREALYLLASTSCALLAFSLSSTLTYVGFWLAITAGLVGAVFALGNLSRVFVFFAGRSLSLRPSQNTALVILGVMIAVVGTEIFLGLLELRAPKAPDPSSTEMRHNPEAMAVAAQHGVSLHPKAAAGMKQREGLLTLPAERAHEGVTVPGSTRSYRWHGVLHVHDGNGFRRTTPFPAKRPNTLRLVVVGDSLTYGYGVDERFTYPSLMERELGQYFKVEVLNLGVSGFNTDRILPTMRRVLPVLRPDLVLYGVCLNDFLPSWQPEYSTRGYTFPISEDLEQFFLSRTRVARLVSDLYDRTLRLIGLRADFFDDILKDFDGYQQQFRRDVVSMNEFVTGKGLPPMIAMVLDQYPLHGGRGYHIAKVAEESLKTAGMDVIQIEDYYHRYNGYHFPVSRWEGHPDELAHAIFASMIIARLTQHPSLQPYRR